MPIIARENPYAKKARAEESSLGPRQPDSAICAGCDDGLSQSIGNFPVIPGGGRSPLCKLHQPMHAQRCESCGADVFPGAKGAGAHPICSDCLRYVDMPGITPFQATDADVDYLGPSVSVFGGLEDGVVGVVVDHGGYEPTPAAHLRASTDPADTVLEVLPASDATALRLQIHEPPLVALSAVPVAPGTIERLTRNQNADVMVRSLAGLVARLEALPARVTSDEEQGVVASLLTEAAAEERNIEALREKLKAPYWDACKTIDGAMGAASQERKTLGVMRIRFGGALAVYQQHRASVAAREADEARVRVIQAAMAETAAVDRAQSATTEEERHRALADADAASLAQVHATMDAQDAETPQKGVRTEAGTLGFTQPWQIEVVNEFDLPREFLTPDMPALRKAIAGKDGRRGIPGCNIFQGHGLRIGK